MGIGVGLRTKKRFDITVIDGHERQLLQVHGVIPPFIRRISLSHSL